MDETVEWCNSFHLVPKANGKGKLGLDLARLNQVLITPVHRGPTLNDIFPKLNNVEYLSLIDASSGYHNPKLDGRSSYLIHMSIWQVQIQKATLFVAAPTSDMSQCKTDKIFKDLPNAFGIMDDNLVVGYDGDGKDHDKTLWQVLQICWNANLKLNKDKCHFRWTSVPFFGGGNFQARSTTQPTKAESIH